MSGLSGAQEFSTVVNSSQVKKIDPIYNVVEEKFKECKDELKNVEWCFFIYLLNFSIEYREKL